MRTSWSTSTKPPGPQNAFRNINYHQNRRLTVQRTVKDSRSINGKSRSRTETRQNQDPVVLEKSGGWLQLRGTTDVRSSTTDMKTLHIQMIQLHGVGSGISLEQTDDKLSSTSEHIARIQQLCSSRSEDYPRYRPPPCPRHAPFTHFSRRKLQYVRMTNPQIE